MLLVELVREGGPRPAPEPGANPLFVRHDEKEHGPIFESTWYAEPTGGWAGKKQSRTGSGSKLPSHTQGGPGGGRFIYLMQEAGWRLNSSTSLCCNDFRAPSHEQCIPPPP